MIQKLYSWYGKRTVQAVAGVIMALALVGIYLVISGGSKEAEPVVNEKPTVEVKAVANMSSAATVSAVGVVQAVSEARLRAEAGGRVTSVNVEIGDAVRAGTVLASLENSSESASVLQAQGAYEAALAGAQQSDSGVRDSETRLKAAEDASLSSVRAAYTTINRTLVSTVDQFFSNPDGQVPGLRIDGQTSFLNSERVAFQAIMPTWQTNVAAAKPADLAARFAEAEKNTIRMIAIVDSLIKSTGDAADSETLLGAPVKSYTAGLLTERNTLNATLASIQGTRSELATANEAKQRAELGGTSGDVSLANAQVKIALGSLRAAQANYEKTIVRSPINGVVNALYVKTGDYMSPSAEAAIVANNSGLEISTSISEEDSAFIQIGDVVTIEETATGTVTAIADAVDPTTGKVALKVSVDESTSLTNGTTVNLSFKKESKAETDKAIIIPLTALKMTGSGPIAFSVSDEKKLVAIPVVLGPVVGDSVTIAEGLTPDTRIVTDARGLRDGQEVTVTTN